MDSQQEATRALIQVMLVKTGWSASRLASEAGVKHTTVTRFLNKEVKHQLSARTLAKLATASGMGVAISAHGPGSPEAIDNTIKDEGELRWVQLWRRMGEDAQRLVYQSLSAMLTQRDDAA